MTINDLCPGFDQLSPLAQAKELCIRSHGDLLNLQCSRRLLNMDKRYVDKALARQELLIEILNKLAGAGPSSCHQEDATQPAPAPLYRDGLWPFDMLTEEEAG